MKRLTTDTPKDNVETALNLFYIKDHETWVRGGGPAPDYPDISLDDYMRMLIRTHIRDAKIPEDWKEFSFMMAEWLFDDADSMEGTLAVLYSAAWAFAELRNRLKLYEDTGLEPEKIKAKLEDAEHRVVQMRKQWQEAEQFICMRCKEFDWEEVDGLICGTKNCGCLTGVPFCDKYASREEAEAALRGGNHE